jgi:hypothetical protein
MPAGLLVRNLSSGTHHQEIGHFEKEMALLLNSYLDGVVPIESSLLLRPLSDDEKFTLFNDTVPFRQRVNIIKCVLRNPNKSKMVKCLPDFENEVVHFSPDIRKIGKFLFMLQSISCIFPELESQIKQVLNGLDVSQDSMALLEKIEKDFLKIRGSSSYVAVVASAAAKV